MFIEEDMMDSPTFQEQRNNVALENAEIEQKGFYKCLKLYIQANQQDQMSYIQKYLGAIQKVRTLWRGEGVPEKCMTAYKGEGVFQRTYVRSYSS